MHSQDGTNFKFIYFVKKMCVILDYSTFSDIFIISSLLYLYHILTLFDKDFYERMQLSDMFKHLLLLYINYSSYILCVENYSKPFGARSESDGVITCSSYTLADRKFQISKN